MCGAAAVWARLDGIVYGARLADMIEYRAPSGNDDWSWRTIDVPAQTVLQAGEPKLFLIAEFMRAECISLFHSVMAP